MPLLSTHPGLRPARLGAPPSGWRCSASSLPLPATRKLMTVKLFGGDGPGRRARRRRRCGREAIRSRRHPVGTPPTAYSSGDNVLVGATKTIAERVGSVDVAVIFAGCSGARAKERGLSFDDHGSRAAAAAEAAGRAVVDPADVDGGSIQRRSRRNRGAFDEAGLLHCCCRPAWRVDRAVLAVASPTR